MTEKIMNDRTDMDEWLEIGIIVAPQGLKGELRVSSTTDFPERFEEPGRRWLQSPQGEIPQAIEMLSGRSIPGKNLYVIQLEGITSREKAETMRGYKLLINKGDRPQLELDEYLVSDLINLEVYNRLTGQKIGNIINIFSAGNDLLEVKLQQPTLSSEPPTNQGQKEKKKLQNRKPATVLIPFVREIVPVVDLEGRRIEIAPPPGLLEIDAG